MPPNPKTGFVTLPKVVTGELAGKFGKSNSQRKRERHEVLAAQKAPPSFLD
jgi:hypothetical protein